ncbi:MAG: hypothetical protein IJO13_01295, partial [Lachnospiraceae bacterium]|nr:hypothetical protein [Lachnospiraceae bacterium]
IPDYEEKTLLEPFAGANNIVTMIESLGYKNQWECFDIAPNEFNAAEQYPIKKRDTLADFPSGYSVAITNPPYLAKNSATRAGLDFPKTHYDDLYKVALDVMLNNLEYVAAIIPESYINAGLFHKRLYAFVSLNCKMFEDTECPVCLALFIPTKQKQYYGVSESDFFVYHQNKKIGNYKTLEKKKPNPKIINNWNFNDPNGPIGIRCIDGTSEPSIEFVYGDEIQASKVKVTSRSLTRVSGLPEDVDLEQFLLKCNNRLIKYREDTSDLFLTSFKGLRKDNKYRRRLDFENARMIMNEVIEIIRKENGNDSTN